MDELHLKAKGPGHAPLATEIAWFGAEEPSRVLIHSSGIHGVEGFAGSAVQLALLDTEIRLAPDAALILVHCLNPYGMAWLRRANENNVDLNRNFLADDDDRVGAAETYRQLNDLLNPTQLGAGRDLFYLRALRCILKYGMQALRQSVAEGQYEYPKGLFYGGDAFESGPLHYLGWLATHLRSARGVFAIDVHTGLGKWGQESLYFRSGSEQRDAIKHVAAELGRELVPDAATHGAYQIRGMLSEVFTMLDPVPEWSFILQEFGTYPAIHVLNTLRRENFWYHHGETSVEHDSRRRLKNVLIPENNAWRARVVERGVSLCQRAAQYVLS